MIKAIEKTYQKKKALAKWILETDENSLNELEGIYNIHYKSQKISSGVIMNSVNSATLTKEI